MFRPAIRVSVALVVAAFLFGCEDRRYVVPRPGMFAPDGGTGTDPDMGVFMLPSDGPPTLDAEDDGPPVDPDGSVVPPDAGPFCGNGAVEGGEACDDGNSRPGDGCSGVCAVEPNYSCPTPGQPCVSLVVCGDGKISGSEACDDANAAGGDGCIARLPGRGGLRLQRGRPALHDGARPSAAATARSTAGEGCDDGNTTAGDGCSATCSLEGGWTCPTPGSACVRDAYCGDGRLDANEQCDDGNARPRRRLHRRAA